MNKQILTDHQINFLQTFGQTPELSKYFYLTGGTALAGFYIPYRYSEDLDFFSEAEIDPLSVQTFLKKNKSQLQIKEVEYQTSFNRNLFFLTLEDNTQLKTEFTYFPFTPLDTQQSHFQIMVDSPLDIATNKVFTIYQRTAARDYMDLYQLCMTYNYKIPDLIDNARSKFDTHIDPLKLAAQFNKAPEVKDIPRLIEEIPQEAWHAFFIQQADALKPKIIES